MRQGKFTSPWHELRLRLVSVIAGALIVLIGRELLPAVMHIYPDYRTYQMLDEAVFASLAWVACAAAWLGLAFGLRGVCMTVFGAAVGGFLITGFLSFYDDSLTWGLAMPALAGVVMALTAWAAKDCRRIVLLGACLLTFGTIASAVIPSRLAATRTAEFSRLALPWVLKDLSENVLWLPPLEQWDRRWLLVGYDRTAREWHHTLRLFRKIPGGYCALDAYRHLEAGDFGVKALRYYVSQPDSSDSGADLSLEKAQHLMRAHHIAEKVIEGPWEEVRNGFAMRLVHTGLEIRAEVSQRLLSLEARPVSQSSDEYPGAKTNRSRRRPLRHSTHPARTDMPTVRCKLLSERGAVASVGQDGVGVARNLTVATRSGRARAIPGNHRRQNREKGIASVSEGPDSRAVTVGLRAACPGRRARATDGFLTLQIPHEGVQSTCPPTALNLAGRKCPPEWASSLASWCG